MSDIQDEIERLESRMDALRDEAEYSRKAILVSRAAVVAGLLGAFGVWLLRDWSATVLLVSIAAVIGGLIGMGANRTTRQEAVEELARCRAQRDALIDLLAPQPPAWS